MFFGNCLNHIYDLAWFSSPDLSIGDEHHSLTIEGATLLLALRPEHHDPLLTQLQQLEITPVWTADLGPDTTIDAASHHPASSPSTASPDATSRQTESR